jgi:sugar phosphate isomerase/epimerase
LTISALSCHDNPISPNKDQAKQAQETFKKTVQLASLLDVPVVNTFSGVAGSDEKLSILTGQLHHGQQSILKY